MIEINGLEITVKSPTPGDERIGSFELEFFVVLDDYLTVSYIQPFTLTINPMVDVIGDDQPSSDDTAVVDDTTLEPIEDTPLITTIEEPPEVILEFIGVGSTELSPWQVILDRRMQYELPSVSHPELIDIGLYFDRKDSELDKCNCYAYRKESNSIHIKLPFDWPRDVDEDIIKISLRYNGIRKIYNIPLVISFDDELPFLRRQGPFS